MYSGFPSPSGRHLPSRLMALLRLLILLLPAALLLVASLRAEGSPQTMLRIGANARRLKLRHGIQMVVIDYLQLIEPENRRDPRQEQVAQISRRLKFLARELQIPVIALAQVNRTSGSRSDR